LQPATSDVCADWLGIAAPGGDPDADGDGPRGGPTPVRGGRGWGAPPRPRGAREAVGQGFFAAHYAGVARGLAKRIFANSGVQTRYGVVNPLIEDPSRWSTSQRMQRYLAEA